MAGGSAFARQLKAQMELNMTRQRAFTIQMMEDFSVMAYADEYEELHDGEPVPQELARRFLTALKEHEIDYCNMALEDDSRRGNNDPTMQYTEGKMDGRLRQILGDIEDWEVRYGRAAGVPV